MARSARNAAMPEFFRALVVISSGRAAATGRNRRGGGQECPGLPLVDEVAGDGQKEGRVEDAEEADDDAVLVGVPVHVSE